MSVCAATDWCSVRQYNSWKYDKAPSKFVVPESRSVRVHMISTGFARYVTVLWNGECYLLRPKLTIWTLMTFQWNYQIWIHWRYVHLIYLWIPIHGPAVNVPTDLTPVCTLLPGFYLKSRWFLWSQRGSCATMGTICTSTFDQQSYLQPYSGWIHCTRITVTGSVMRQRMMLNAAGQQNTAHHCISHQLLPSQQHHHNLSTVSGSANMYCLAAT